MTAHISNPHCNCDQCKVAVANGLYCRFCAQVAKQAKR